MKGIKRKTGLKRAAIAAVAIMLCFQITGCGKDEENTTAQKEFVYVPEYQDIDGEGGGMENINIIGDTIYYMSSTYDESTQVYTPYLCALKVGEKTPVKMPIDIPQDSSISKISADADGNMQAVILTYIYDEDADSASGEEAEAESEDGDKPAAEGNTKEKAEEDTEDKADANADTEENTDAAADAGTEEDAADKEETEDTEAIADSGGGTASNMVITSGGGGAVYSSTMSPSVAGVDNEYREPISQKLELCSIAADGTITPKTDLSSIFKDEENAYFQHMEIDKDGNIYLCTDRKVWVLDKEGKELFKIELDSWVNNMFSTKDGIVMLSYYGQENIEIHPIDLAAKGVGEATKSIMISQYGSYVFAKGNDTDVLFSVDNKLYSYNLGDEAPTEILSWIDCDINSDEIRSFAALEDGRILVITLPLWNVDSETISLAYLTKKKGSEVEEKKILNFATMSLGYDIKKQIIAFNKTNQEYRIEVKEYMSEDYYSGLAQLNTDIVGGNCPDIIDLSFGSMKQYTAKGILEDLYPYIDNDPDLNREDYLENVLKAYETDGKLYALSQQFYIRTIMAKVSDVGDRQSITLDELTQIVEEMPEETELYEYATKDAVLRNNIMMNLDQYVNWSTGECTFTGEDFLKALEFANKFDKEYDYNQEGPGAAERLHDGTLMMVNTSISSVQDYQMYEGMFGEPIAFVGYPTSKENGSYIAGAGSVLSMSAKSKYKEGVWQFIRAGITKEAQEKEYDGGGWGMPIMKSALEAQFEKDMTEEYYEDADGNKVKQMKTTWGMDGFSMDIYAATEEQVAVVRNLIESVDTLYQYDEQISNIIMEEAVGFFEGQKNAKDVADIIQSRVQIYVNENR